MTEYVTSRCAHHWTTTSECPKCLRKQLDAAEAECERLRDALNGLIGLVQLVSMRGDMPTGLDDLMMLNHRMTEAKAAIAAGEGKK
jgi:primosomal protein N'